MASSNAWYWWVIVAVVVVGLALFGQLGGEKEAQLRKEGNSARARVLSAKQTGTWVANNPEVELELQVSGGGAMEYQAQLRAVIPQVNLAAVQPGSVLRVRVAPDDPQHVVLDESWAH